MFNGFCAVILLYCIFGNLSSENKVKIMKKQLTEKVLKEELTDEQYEQFKKTSEEQGIEEALLNLPDLGDEYYDKVEITGAFNNRIKEVRQENKLTQMDLANILDVSQKEYWRYEQAGYSPNIIKIAYIAMFYNISIDWLSGFTNEKKPFYTNRPVYDGATINGYNLKKMKEAKEKGVKYEPEKRIY